MGHPEPPHFSKRKALNPGKGWDGMPLASLQKPCSSSQGVRTPPGAERDLCLDSAMWPCGAWASRFHPALRPPPCRGPNCEEGLGNIFSVLILYFPFPPHNIKHNFALSVSLRLRFVDVSTWKHDPPPPTGSPPCVASGRPLLHRGFQGFWNTLRERERDCSKGQKGAYQNPAIISNPLSLCSRSECVFDVRLVVGLFV